MAQPLSHKFPLSLHNNNNNNKISHPGLQGGDSFKVLAALVFVYFVDVNCNCTFIRMSLITPPLPVRLIYCQVKLDY